jgi:hypothetical protein
MTWLQLIKISLVLCFSCTAYGETPVQTKELRQHLEEFNKYAKYPLPVLTEDQLQRLVDGKIAKIREKSNSPDEAQRVVGFIIINQSREKTWIAVRDPHFSSHPSFTEQNLSPLGERQVLWYQYFDVPRPFTDRQWLITVEDNHEMAKKTNNTAWEHPWNLTPNGPSIAKSAINEGKISGVTSTMGDKAIFAPVNNGAWVAIRLSETQTLLGFHASTVVGGRIPDRLIADYAMFNLSKTLEVIAERAIKVYEHYNLEHSRVPGGDGVPLPSQ